jgi:hypothetical protein
MKSFDFRLEPRPAPRFAAVATFVHLGAAASPWFLGVPAWLAAGLAVAALAGLGSTLASIPGRHHGLEALVFDRAGCRVRFSGAEALVPAELGAGSRAIAGLAFVEVRAGPRRFTWLLCRAGLPSGQFRRLKARVRFSC